MFCWWQRISNQPELTGVGSTEAETRQLSAAKASLNEKELAHEAMVNHVHLLTNDQNVLIAQSWNVIGKIRSAAKVQFFRDKLMQKEFHVGGKTQQKVAGTTAELSYMKGLTTTYATQLATRGIGAADITGLNACYDGLQAKDAEQENAKKLQTTLRNERDTLLKDLRDMKSKIRGSAAICFRGNPDILNEFKTIIRKKSAKKSDTDTSTETPTAG
ncbi:MAG: hypothetical protein WC703_08105 [Candidatus Neomarinimicrobiota bacterium]